MRRTFLLTAAFLVGASGAALADRGAPSVSHGPTTTDVYTFSSSSQGRLGLVVLGLTDELKQFFGSGKGGVLVGKVEPGSPADKAGIKVGDVLADVDGKPVDDAGDVLSLLSGKKKGDAVALTVMRNHLPMMISAKLQADVAAMPQGMMMRDPFQGMALPPGFGASGLDDDAMKRLEQRLDRLEQRLNQLQPQPTH